MIRVAVTGAGGRMGKTLIEAIAINEQVQLSAAIERPDSTLIGVDSGELAGIGRNDIAVVDSLEAVIDDFDVLIDFTAPVATAANATLCAAKNKHMVIGTTGFTDTQMAAVDTLAESTAISAPVLTSALNYLISPPVCLATMSISKSLKLTTGIKWMPPPAPP